MLATKLIKFGNQPDVIVLGLPRGGVPVAYEVACTLNAPLDVFMVPKLGVSGEEELAFGAIATGGVRLLNVDLIVGISKNMINAITSQELKELERRERLIEGIASD